MRTTLKWIFRSLIVLGVVIIMAGLWKPEETTRLLAVNSLFCEDKIVYDFSNMDAAFLTVPVPRGAGPTRPLAYGPKTDLPSDTADWIPSHSVTSLFLIKNSKIVFKDYVQGTTADDRRISWSIAKNHPSALVGMLLPDATISSLGLQYAPYYLTDKVGTAFVSGGLNMTTRDVDMFRKMTQNL